MLDTADNIWQWRQRDHHVESPSQPGRGLHVRIANEELLMAGEETFVLSEDEVIPLYSGLQDENEVGAQS